MGACATKPGDLKVKGEAPLAVEDAGEEKAKAVGVPVAAEADPADASRRRSLSDLLKQDAETSDGEVDQEAAEKAVAVESANAAAGDSGATMGSSQTPVPDATEHDGTAQELKVDPNGAAQEAEEEKQVDPESVQVAAAAAAAASPSAEESKGADEDVSA